MRIVRLLMMLTVAVALLGAHATADNGEQRTAPPNLQWFREAKFGMFIHWGPVSLMGTEISWSRKSKRGFTDKYPTIATIPEEEYDNLYKRFNPVKFDARKIVGIAKAAGMKYLVFTAKHHDGFCNFDTKLTDYSIMNGPYGKDITKELADACRAAGIRFGIYFSGADWHHPDFETDCHARFLDYFKGQLRELCTGYGKVSILWFDLAGDSFDPLAVAKMLRTLQPGILLNSRAGSAWDFDTLENTIGVFQNKKAWETCMPIGDQWSWTPNEKIKPLKVCLHTLIRSACGDGNLLFNVGPDSTGLIEPAQVERLKEMGQWLAKYGRTIYGTRGGPFVLGSAGGSTFKHKTIYLHILEWPEDGLDLPPLSKKIVSCRVLTGGNVAWEQNDSGIRLSLPAECRNAFDTIIEMTVDGSASEIAPVRCPTGSLTFGRKMTASNTLLNSKDYAPDKAADYNWETRWATDVGVSSAWIEVDLGGQRSFDHALISEAGEDRALDWELQVLRGDQWETVYKGDNLGDRREISFSLVTAQHVRLNILKATGSPTICEFELNMKK